MPCGRQLVSGLPNMKSAGIVKTTKALHVAWALFVVSFFILYLPEIASSGNILLTALVFAPNEHPIGLTLGTAFCLAPFFTQLALQRPSTLLFIIAVTMNSASVIFGAKEFIKEFNLNNAMILLAIAVPLATVVAAALGITRTYLKIIDSMTAGPYTCSHAAVVRRSMGTNSVAFSRGAYSRRSPGPQTDPNPSRPGSGALDSKHGCAMASAPAVLSQLQGGASPIPTMVSTRGPARGSHPAGQHAA